MDILSELKIDSSLNRKKKLANYVSDNPDKFPELMEYFFSEDYRIAQRASNAVNMCVEKDNALIEPYISRIIENLKSPAHDAVKRNSIRLFQFIDLPEEYCGDVADICFSYLDSEKEAIAVRAFSMTVLYNIAMKYPAIKDELKMMIEDHLPYGSAGIKARGKNILKMLEKI